jgi:hypothetical protein
MGTVGGVGAVVGGLRGGVVLLGRWGAVYWGFDWGLGKAVEGGEAIE